MVRRSTLSPQPPLKCLSPKYTPECWGSVGKGLAITALDMVNANPCSRLGAPGREVRDGLGRLKGYKAAATSLKDAFTKDTNMDKFTGLTVQLSTGETGKIEGGFGQSGKFRVYVKDGLAEVRDHAWFKELLSQQLQHL